MTIAPTPESETLTPPANASSEHSTSHSDKPKTVMVEQELEAHAPTIYPFLIVTLASILALWGELDLPLIVSFIGDLVLVLAICGTVFELSKSMGWKKIKAD